MPGVYHCRHYSYDLPKMRACCARGIDNNAPGATKRCFPEPSGEPCSAREDLSLMEREERDAKRRAIIDRLNLCMAAIPAGKPGDSGEVRCPSCGSGSIHYGRSPTNGHLWAVCTTSNCFQVME